MRKTLAIVFAAIIITVTADLIIAVELTDSQRSQVQEMQGLKSQFDKQEKMISNLKSIILSGAAAGVAVLLVGIGILSYVMKLNAQRHIEHVSQQIHNYHHAHHEEEFDHTYHEHHLRAAKPGVHEGSGHHHDGHHESHHHDHGGDTES